MYAPLELAYLILALVIPGHFFLRAVGLRSRDDRLAWTGWCVGAGALLAGLTLFVWYWVAPGTLTIARLSIAQAIEVLLLIFVARQFRVETDSNESEAVVRAPRWERVLFGLAVALCLSSACSDVLRFNRSPALRGDEAQFWGIRAQAIDEVGGLGSEYSARVAKLAVPHRDYPLLGTLLIAWTYEKRGEVSFSSQRLPLQLLAIGVLLILAGALRRLTRPLLAASILLLVAEASTTNTSLGSASADGMVALGVLIAVDGWLRWRAQPHPKYAFLASIGLAIAIASKNEGLLYATCALAVLLVLALLRFTFRDAQAERATPRLQFRAWSLAWLCIPLAPAGLQYVFNESAGFENDLTSGMGTGIGFFARLQDQALDYFATTAQFYVDRVFLDASFDGFLLVLLLVAVLMLPMRLRDPQVLGPLCFLAFSMTGIFLVYLSTPQPLEWHLETSACRVTGQVLPIAGLCLAGLLGRAASERDSISSMAKRT